MIYVVNRETCLAHHGIMGQRWGIRRYQNYDGSYTSAGLKRYNTAKDLYDTAKKAYQEGKISKYDYGMAKRNEKTAYKQLKKDAMAEKGRYLREKGQTITGNTLKSSVVGAIGSGIGSAGFYTAYNMYRNGKNAGMVNALTAASAISVGASFAYSLFQGSNNKAIRMSYLHSSRYIDNGNQKVKNMLDKRLGNTKVSEINDAARSNNATASNVQFKKNGKIKSFTIDADTATSLKKNRRATINL